MQMYEGLEGSKGSAGEGREGEDWTRGKERTKCRRFVLAGNPLIAIEMQAELK